MFNSLVGFCWHVALWALGGGGLFLFLGCFFFFEITLVIFVTVPFPWCVHGKHQLPDDTSSVPFPLPSAQQRSLN